MNSKTVVITQSNFSESRNKIAELLKQTKATPKEINIASLLIEENFFRLKAGMADANRSHHDAGIEDSDVFSAEVEIQNRFGSISINMTAIGKEFNPIPKITEVEGFDEEDAYRLAILKSHRDKMRYVRKSDKNLVVINVHGLNSSKKQLFQTIAGLILGIVCGFLMQIFLDASTIKTVQDGFINPLRGLFLNALNMMMAPVTFFAIMAGVTNISDAALIGKLGGKMVIVACFMQIIIAGLGLGIGLLFFSGDLSYIQAGISQGGATISNTVSIKDMIFGIVPKNLVDPFKGGNILQVMFLAIFFGIIANKMGEQAKVVTDVVDFLFRFMLAVLKVIVKAIPFIVFLSMTALLASTGIDAILTFGSLFVALFVGVLAVWAVGAFTIALFGKINPIYFTKKFAALSPLVFSVSSSHARLPFVLKFCSEKLGIDGKLSAFSVPVGVQLNKAGNCTYFGIATLMLMSVYNIETTPELFFTLWISVFIMAIAKPPVPCGGIICVAYLLTVVGVPPEAISVIICLDPIAAMFNGVCNESGNITTTFILAKNSAMLDEKKYFAM